MHLQQICRAAQIPALPGFVPTNRSRTCPPAPAAGILAISLPGKPCPSQASAPARRVRQRSTQHLAAFGSSKQANHRWTPVNTVGGTGRGAKQSRSRAGEKASSRRDTKTRSSRTWLRSSHRRQGIAFAGRAPRIIRRASLVSRLAGKPCPDTAKIIEGMLQQYPILVSSSPFGPRR